MQTTKTRDRLSQRDRIAVYNLMKANRRSWQRMTAQELTEQISAYDYPVKVHVVRDLRKTLEWPRVTKPSRPHRVTPKKVAKKLVEHRKAEIYDTLSELKHKIDSLETLMDTL